jgi:antitoxin component of RelBE/YafQ-DinJ toxin-antitoxin module
MGKVMATVNFRVDEALKEKSYSILKLTVAIIFPKYLMY